MAVRAFCALVRVTREGPNSSNPSRCADCRPFTGAKVGGLGNMPGWWFTIESTTTKHFIVQFKTAIEDALSAKPAIRAIMRARATKQRFPVSQWVEDLEILQSSAVEISHKQAAKERRPTLETPSTPAILEAPGLLSVLQSRFAKPSLRPRPAVAQASAQLGGLAPIDEGRLLAGPSPGLGSKLGPGTKRKRPPPPLSRKTTGTVPQMTATDLTSQALPKISRPSINLGDSTPDFQRRQQQIQVPQMPKRPTIQRAPTMPHLRPNDRKAVKLLGMQIPANQVSALTASNNSPSSTEADSTAPTTPKSTPITPLSANSGYYSPASTPLSSHQRFSINTNDIAATSVSAADISDQVDKVRRASILSNHRRGSQVANTRRGSLFTNIKRASQTTNTKRLKPKSAVKVAPQISSDIRAESMFASLGPHYFPHGSVAALSTSDIKEEKPDNMLQNVVPFFSDPQKEYENLFKQRLKRLNGKTSESQLCIEEYLLKSEKTFFGKLRAAELTRHPEKLPEQPATSMVKEIRKKTKDGNPGPGDVQKSPAASGLKRIMRLKIGDWPIYSFLLAFVSKRS